MQFGLRLGPYAKVYGAKEQMAIWAKSLLFFPGTSCPCSTDGGCSMPLIKTPMTWWCRCSLPRAGLGAPARPHRCDLEDFSILSRAGRPLFHNKHRGEQLSRKHPPYPPQSALAWLISPCLPAGSHYRGNYTGCIPVGPWWYSRDIQAPGHALWSLMWRRWVRGWTREHQDGTLLW